MVIGHKIAMGLRLAYRSMHRKTNASLSRFGITADQFVVLGLLMEQDGVSQRELCSRASSDPNTIRAILLLMEKKGLLLREPSKDDGRALNVLVTKAGRDLYGKLSKALEPLQERLAGLFPQGESQRLIESLDRISRNMDQPD